MWKYFTIWKQFNNLLKKMHVIYEHSSAWPLIYHYGITLISREEDSESFISASESLEFLNKIGLSPDSLLEEPSLKSSHKEDIYYSDCSDDCSTYQLSLPILECTKMQPPPSEKDD